MTKLISVRVNKRDSCLSYALKRIGKDHGIYSTAKDIPKELLLPYRLENTQVGQILVWKSRKSYYLWSTEIQTLSNGKPAIIKNNEFAGLHFGVVEHLEESDDGIIITVSDCIRNGNAHSFPTIGLSTICLRDEAKSSTESRIPTYILNI